MAAFIIRALTLPGVLIDRVPLFDIPPLMVWLPEANGVPNMPGILVPNRKHQPESRRAHSRKPGTGTSQRHPSLVALLVQGR